MKIIKITGSILRSACVVFTVILLCAYSVLLATGFKDAYIIPSVVLGIFFFSVMLSIANFIYFKTSINRILAYLIHLFMTVGTALIILSLPGKGNGGALLFVVTCLAVIHVLFFLIYNIIAMKKGKREEYKSVYDSLKKDRI